MFEVWRYCMKYTLTKCAPSKYWDNNVAQAKVDPKPGRSVAKFGQRSVNLHYFGACYLQMEIWFEFSILNLIFFETIRMYNSPIRYHACIIDQAVMWFFYSFDWPYSDYAEMRDDDSNDTILKLGMNSKNTMHQTLLFCPSVIYLHYSHLYMGC